MSISNIRYKCFSEMLKFFPRGRSALSEIFNYMVDHVSEGKGHVLKSFNQTFLSRKQMKLFCESISSKGSPYKRCFGFIDGTVRAVCRPIRDQREVPNCSNAPRTVALKIVILYFQFYNGHKRLHSIKFQSLMLPNDIIQNMFGSVIGRRHDEHLLARSKLIQKLQLKFQGLDNPPYLYGDSGYPLSTSIIILFKGNLTGRQRRVNKQMSRVRVSVEWGFGKIIQLFSFEDFKKISKLGKRMC